MEKWSTGVVEWWVIGVLYTHYNQPKPLSATWRPAFQGRCSHRANLQYSITPTLRRFLPAPLFGRLCLYLSRRILAIRPPCCPCLM